jgi:hypothetical protein
VREKAKIEETAEETSEYEWEQEKNEREYKTTKNNESGLERDKINLILLSSSLCFYKTIFTQLSSS